MIILKFIKPKFLGLLILILLLCYFIFRLESLNYSYNELKSFSSDNITVSAENLKRDVMVSDILKGELLDIENLYLLNQENYSVPFSYSNNPEFFDNINNNYFKSFMSVFVEKEFNTKLLSDVNLGIDISKIEFEENKESLKIIYFSDALVNIDTSFNESLFNSDIGLFRSDFSESDRALILEDMHNYIESSILNDSDLIKEFKNRINNYITSKINSILLNEDIYKEIEIDINFNNIK